MNETRQDHFKERTHQAHVKHLQKYAMHLEAVRWNEGFQRETDAAFAKFLEREGESLRNTAKKRPYRTRWQWKILPITRGASRTAI